MLTHRSSHDFTLYSQSTNPELNRHPQVSLVTRPLIDRNSSEIEILSQSSTSLTRNKTRLGYLRR